MSLSKRVRFQVLIRDNYTCQYCGAKPPDTVLEIDHVIPRCKGGSDRIENLKTACWNCNRGKAGMLLMGRWELYHSELQERGPRCGEVVERAERYPAYWVFECEGEFQFFEDEIDEDLFLSEWEQRLKWGPPGGRRGFPSQKAVVDQWDTSYPKGFPRERRLVGFYLPLDPDNSTDCKPLLGWFPGAAAMDWLTIHTQRYGGGVE